MGRYSNKSNKGASSRAVLFGILALAGIFFFSAFYATQPPSTTGQTNPQTKPSENVPIKIGNLPIEFMITQPPPNTNPTTAPVPTSPLSHCYDNAAVLFMIDRSGSMGADGMREIRGAIESFAANFSDNSLVGIQSFAGKEDLSPDIKEHLAISKFGSIRSSFKSILESIKSTGSTPTNSALQYSLNTLREATKKNSGRNFTYIFMTDGAPHPVIERAGIPGTSADIRALGVTIYGVGIEDQNDPLALELISSIASDPDSQYVYQSPNASDLTQIYNEIAQKICN